MSPNSEASIRSALRGRTLLVVGGYRREAALERLCRGLDLDRVEHCATRKEDASPRVFGGRLHQEGLILVVWVLGLSRTHHGKYLHRTCRDLGIPFIDCARIPHPDSLVARLADLRLEGALYRRRALLLAGPAAVGGAA